MAPTHLPPRAPLPDNLTKSMQYDLHSVDNGSFAPCLRGNDDSFMTQTVVSIRCGDVQEMCVPLDVPRIVSWLA